MEEGETLLSIPAFLLNAKNPQQKIFHVGTGISDAALLQHFHGKQPRTKFFRVWKGKNLFTATKSPRTNTHHSPLKSKPVPPPAFGVFARHHHVSARGTCGQRCPCQCTEGTSGRTAKSFEIKTNMQMFFRLFKNTFQNVFFRTPLGKDARNPLLEFAGVNVPWWHVPRHEALYFSSEATCRPCHFDKVFIKRSLASIHRKIV